MIISEANFTDNFVIILQLFQADLNKSSIDNLGLLYTIYQTEIPKRHFLYCICIFIFCYT